MENPRSKPVFVPDPFSWPADRLVLERSAARDERQHLCGDNTLELGTETEQRYVTHPPLPFKPPACVHAPAPPKYLRKILRRYTTDDDRLPNPQRRCCLTSSFLLRDAGQATQRTHPEALEWTAHGRPRPAARPWRLGRRERLFGARTPSQSDKQQHRGRQGLCARVYIKDRIGMPALLFDEAQAPDP